MFNQSVSHRRPQSSPHLAGRAVATQHATARWCQPTGAPKRGELDAPLHAALLLGCRCRCHGRRSSLLLVAPPCRGTLILCAVSAQSALQGGMARITSQASPICDQGRFCCYQPDVMNMARADSQAAPTHLSVRAALQRGPAAKQGCWVGGRGHFGGRCHREAEGVCRHRDGDTCCEDSPGICVMLSMHLAIAPHTFILALLQTYSDGVTEAVASTTHLSSR